LRSRKNGNSRTGTSKLTTLPERETVRIDVNNVEFEIQLPSTTIEKKYDPYVTILRKFRPY